MASAIPKSKKPEEKVVSQVSAILGPKCITRLQTEAKDKVAISEGEFNLEKNRSFCFGHFNNCTITFNVSSK